MPRTGPFAADSGLSHTIIRRIWIAFGLQPHRAETFKLSSDALFVDKVQDIVGLYMSPPDRAIVLCVDEKSQIQALDREQPVLPMAPGVPERRTHTYVRNGTTALFAALDIATGAVIGHCYKRHRATQFLDFLKRIDAEMPNGPDVHLVMDNYQVERWFAELTRKQLQRGVHRSTAELEADIKAFIETHNENPTPYKWVKSANQILASVKRFCQKTMNRTSDSGD